MITIRSNKFIPSLYGGLIIAAIEVLPGLNFINACCCAGILIGGFLSVFFYTQQFEKEEKFLTKSDCTELGIFTGIIAAIAGVVISILIRSFFGNLNIELMIQFIYNMGLEIPAEVQTIIDEALTQKITFFDIIINLIFNLIVNVIFGLLGGLIGWNFYKDKNGITNLYS